MTCFILSIKITNQVTPKKNRTKMVKLYVNKQDVTDYSSNILICVITWFTGFYRQLVYIGIYVSKRKKCLQFTKPRRPTKKYSLQKYGKRMSREGQTVTYTNIISIRDFCTCFRSITKQLNIITTILQKKIFLQFNKLSKLKRDPRTILC